MYRNRIALLPRFLFERAVPFLFNLPCDPKISQRGSWPMYYPEFRMFPGPQALAVTGDNSFNTLFGREWAILFCDNHEFYLMQWTDGGEEAPPGLESGGWAVITDPLLTLPTFTGSERSFTAAFDQSARLILAYELDGIVKVTRWDNTASAYVQNVIFAGADPTLLMDASITYDVGDSDVILFYLDSARTTVQYRVQREVYSVEHDLTFGDATAVGFPEGVVLDAARALVYRYELLIAYPLGTKRPLALVSDVYPIPGKDALSAAVAVPTWSHVVLIVRQVEINPLVVTIPSVPTWAHVDTLKITSDENQILVTIPTMPNWAHTETLVIRLEDDSIVVSVPSFPTWVHESFLLVHEPAAEGIAVTLSGAQPAWQHKEA